MVRLQSMNGDMGTFSQQSITTNFSFSSFLILILSLLVYCVLFSQHLFDNDQNVNLSISRYSLLAMFANTSMVWDISTTPIPITTTAALIKNIFSANLSSCNHIPVELRHLVGEDTIRVHEVRKYINKKRFEMLRLLCSEERRSDCKRWVNEADPEFGITPLHLAKASGDIETAAFLESLGADAGKMDSANRKPQNLSFTSFVSNSKKWARQSGRFDCDFPVVDLSSDPNPFAEIRRLVSEGEPVLIRNAAQKLIEKVEKDKTIDLEKLIEENGEATVSVGEVPYANYFGLPSTITTLKNYYESHVPSASSFSEREDYEPLYIFQKNNNVTAFGLRILSELLLRAFPVPDMICPVDLAKDAESIHFFLGAKNSGAPFHIHGDAVNFVLRGSKQWYIYPPLQAIYSRKHIMKREGRREERENEEGPLECIQRAGDAVYIPFDWAHAVLNLEHQTFGYALELLNRREVLASLPSHYRKC